MGKQFYQEAPEVEPAASEMTEEQAKAIAQPISSHERKVKQLKEFEVDPAEVDDRENSSLDFGGVKANTPAGQRREQTPSQSKSE